MTTVNYPTPVTVNGFSCKNCTDVDLAKKHIDPAHPKDGPYGIDAKNQPQSVLTPQPVSATSNTPAVTFGGVFSGQSAASNSNPQTVASGQHVNLTA